MQRLQSLFGQSRQATAVRAQAQQLRQLDTASLKLVAGGLPRIGGLSQEAPNGVGAEPLPRVS